MYGFVGCLLCLGATYVTTLQGIFGLDLCCSARAHILVIAPAFDQYR